MVQTKEYSNSKPPRRAIEERVYDTADHLSTTEFEDSFSNWPCRGGELEEDE